MEKYSLCGFGIGFKTRDLACWLGESQKESRHTGKSSDFRKKVSARCKTMGSPEMTKKKKRKPKLDKCVILGLFKGPHNHVEKKKGLKTRSKGEGPVVGETPGRTV